MSTRAAIAVVLVALVAANLISHLLLPGRPWPVAVALTAGLIAVAVAAGMSPAEIGLARGDARRGLRWGAAAGAIAVAVYGIALLVPAATARVPADPLDGASVLLTVLVVIPLTTVLPEELAFRGVLLGLLDRTLRQRFAIAVSSALFGLWHVLAARSGTPASRTAADSVTGVVGNPTTSSALLITGTILVTTAGGYLLCWLRVRSRSLLAPMLAHWALNAGGVLFAAIA